MASQHGPSTHAATCPLATIPKCTADATAALGTGYVSARDTPSVLSTHPATNPSATCATLLAAIASATYFSTVPNGAGPICADIPSNKLLALASERLPLRPDGVGSDLYHVLQLGRDGRLRAT